MLTRRTFLAGAAGSITAALVQKYEWFISEKGEPLIEAPAFPSTDLYVSAPDGEWVITLGPPDEDPGTGTWTEFLTAQYDIGPLDQESLIEAGESWGIEPELLDTECEWETWYCYWGRNLSPRAHAYRLLQSLDLGPKLSGARGEVGELNFLDAPFICSDYLGVHAADDLSVSLLQHRLNELKTGIRVVVDNDFAPWGD